ncbi:hypothetical protein HPB49_020820 [Dermacentor silvarum]|uniref:Uncharacterized protein n=1 Tax=Dermacentor silvarum TaxID=543639 RepID=A0ACB8DR09_DERSI|nr:hypothetical protein HPB49_020820 [Dermacentor silvarum]
MPSIAIIITCVLLHAPALGARSSPPVRQNAISADGGCSPKPQGISIGERATCTFTSSVDVDATRIPAELPVVKCHCPSNLCSSKGDYRCQEVRSTYRVAYRGGTTGLELTDGTVELTTSCVCAVSRTAVAGSGGVRTSNIGKEPA